MGAKGERGDRQFLDRLHAAVEQAFPEPDLTVERLAKAVGVSERHLQRRLPQLTGKSPAEYLTEYRLRKACERLRSAESIGDVAHAAGFSSHAYFAFRFKARFGITPSEFKRQAERVGPLGPKKEDPSPESVSSSPD